MRADRGLLAPRRRWTRRGRRRARFDRAGATLAIGGRDDLILDRRRRRPAHRGRVLELLRQGILAGPAERSRRLDHIALLRVRVAEIAPGALVAGQRLVDVAELERDQPQVAARVRVQRRRAGDLAVGRVRLGEPPELVAHEREQVQRLHVLGRVGQRAQDLALRLAEALGGDQLTGGREMGHRGLHARRPG